MRTLHFIDWSGQDKHYLVPKKILQEFYERILDDNKLNSSKDSNDMGAAWDWFVKQGIDYTANHINADKPIKSINLDIEVFLDFDNALECLDDWVAAGYVEEKQ